MPAVALAAFAGAAVQSATGLGFALVAGPVLVAVLEPQEALLTLSVLGLLISTLVAAEGGPVARDLLRPVLVFAIPGAVAGVVVLRALPSSGLQLAVGLAVLVAVVLRLRGRPLDAPAPAMGLVTGVLTTSVGVNGPPLALWLDARGLDAVAVRATLAAAFVALGALALVLLVASGASVDALELLAGVAGLLAGHRAGRLAFARLDAAAHQRLVLVVIAAAGVASVVGGLA